MMVIRMEDVQIVARKIRIRPHEREMLVQELNKLSESRKRDRTPLPPPPEGGITLTQGEIKYGINHNTIRRWARAGLVPIILENKKSHRIYVDEQALAELVEKYKSSPFGKGYRTAYKDKN